MTERQQLGLTSCCSAVSQLVPWCQQRLLMELLLGLESCCSAGCLLPVLAHHWQQAVLQSVAEHQLLPGSAALLVLACRWQQLVLQSVRELQLLPGLAGWRLS